MTRLSNRSLLLTTVLTLTPMLSGITAVEGAGTEFQPAASAANNRSSSAVTVPTQRQASDAAMNVTDLNPEEIVKQLKDAFDKNKALLTPQHTAKDQDVVVFLGNTGAGKSTLINYLAGKDLRVDGSELVLSAPEDPEAMIIGTNMFASETLYPRSIDVSIPGRAPLRFFDLPGLNDTDGSVRNLVNAAFVRRILLDAQTVRFVIVLGEGQFTNDRGQSVISTLRGLNQLFALEGETQPLDRGMCVVTKENGLMTNIEAATRAFPLQVLRWRSMERIVPMYHANVYHKNTTEHRQTLLQKIGGLEPNKLTSVNVNSIYPPESIQALDRMYSRMFRDAYEKRKGISKTTVSEYESEIAAWRQDDFWQSFEANYFNDAYPSVGILRDISEESYRTSRDAFVGGHQADRDAYILTLERMKKERIEAIELETVRRSEQTVAAIKAEQGIEGIVPFDFANHPLYQEHVCGLGILESITPDRKEHEIARMAFATWIGRYYQTQLDQELRRSLHSQINALKQSQEQEVKALRELHSQDQKTLASLQSMIDALNQTHAQEAKASKEALLKEQKLRESLQSQVDALKQSQAQEAKASRELLLKEQQIRNHIQSQIDALKQSHEQEAKASKEALLKEQKFRESLQSQVDALKQSHAQDVKVLTEVQRQASQNLGQNPVIIAIQRQLQDLIMDANVPEIARGYVDIYRRFLKGKLVYKPNKDNDEGRKEFPIAALANPLEGTFDISRCGDSAQNLQISTGFRTRKEPANASKLEVWIVPQFVLQKDPRAKPYNDFLQTQEKHCNKPFAILFTWGGWADNDYDHLVTGVDGNEIVNIENAAMAKLARRLGEPQGQANAWETIEHGHGKFLYNNE